MDSDSPPPLGTDLPPASSLLARLANVFVAPGEVFDEIKLRPVATFNWLLPMILSIVVAWISAGVIYSQDFARQQMGAMQEQAMRKQFEKMVTSGKMTQAQMEDMLEKNMKIAYMVVWIGAFVGAPFSAAGTLFLGGVVVWLLGTKAMKGQFGYLKAVEVLGLVSLIAALGTIVRTLLVLVKGSFFASPSLALLLQDTNPTDPLFGLLSLVNVFSLWELSVLSLGLGKVASASFGRAAAWVLGIWFLIMGGMVGIGALVTKAMPH